MPKSAPEISPRFHGRITGTAEIGSSFRNAITVQTLATAGAGTYTAAIIKAGGRLFRDCAGAGRTDTTDTALNIISTCGLDANGEQVRLEVYNSSDAAEAITLAGGDGVTVIANEGAADLVMDQGAKAELVFMRTSSTTVLCTANKFHA